MIIVVSWTPNVVGQLDERPCKGGNVDPQQWNIFRIPLIRHYLTHAVQIAKITDSTLSMQPGCPGERLPHRDNAPKGQQTGRLSDPQFAAFLPRGS